MVTNDLARPRDYRSRELLDLVDHLHEIITGTEMPDVAVTPSVTHLFSYDQATETVALQ